MRLPSARISRIAEKAVSDRSKPHWRSAQQKKRRAILGRWRIESSAERNWARFEIKGLKAAGGLKFERKAFGLDWRRARIGDWRCGS